MSEFTLNASSGDDTSAMQAWADQISGATMESSTRGIAVGSFTISDTIRFAPDSGYGRTYIDFTNAAIAWTGGNDKPMLVFGDVALSKKWFDTTVAGLYLYQNGAAPTGVVGLQIEHSDFMRLDKCQVAILEVGGPEALSPLEAVRIFEEVKGQKFAVEHVPEEALEAQKAAAPDPLQETFAALTLNYAAGDAIDMEATLKTFPLHLASVRDYAVQVARSA